MVDCTGACASAKRGSPSATAEKTTRTTNAIRDIEKVIGADRVRFVRTEASDLCEPSHGAQALSGAGALTWPIFHYFPRIRSDFLLTAFASSRLLKNSQ
jgi:hypothetical protein